MAEAPRNVAVFGATGSIGRNALEVIAASGGRLKVTAISANRSFDRLVEIAKKVKPKFVVAVDAKAAKEHNWRGLPPVCKLLTGPEGLVEVATDDEIDTVLAAIVGSAGLESTIAAIKAQKTIALANKEAMVLAGPIVRKLAAKHGATILPVDSEHSAIFQALQCGDRHEVRRIVLTASGGPFRTWSHEQLMQVTVEEALAHPTWDMGPKITIDSATLMNKALEIVEARWLFDLPAEKIDVVLHPQSIVHSLVEFVDGAVIAQLSPPDMKLPIQYALDYPFRRGGVAERLDWTQTLRLDFEPPNYDQFPALQLGMRCAADGGTTGAVLNAANEAAVKALLEGDLHFTEIVPACRSILESHNYDADPTLKELIELDRWARQEVRTWMYA